jgi:hypothetical protein
VRRGYQGLNCDCKRCQGLTDAERAAKQERIRRARSRGGKTRSAQPSMQEARSAGFWRTMELHPWFGRGHLRRKIKAQNELRRRNVAMRSVIVGSPAGRRRPMPGRRYQF